MICPAFSKVKVKSYVRPLVIGLLTVDRRLGRVGGLGLLERGDLRRRARRRRARRLAGSAVSPESDTVPKSEVIEVSLSGVSGDSLDATNSNSDLAARLRRSRRSAAPQVNVAERDSPDRCAVPLTARLLRGGLGDLARTAAGQGGGGGSPHAASATVTAELRRFEAVHPDASCSADLFDYAE